MLERDILAGTERNPRVLIVEDDPVSAMLVQKLLRSQDIHVDRAANGRIAIDLHARNRYRLVISDWMMPEIDGVQLCRELRALEGPYVYFILCSAKGERAERIQAFQAGVDDFLTKPLDKEELHARLNVSRRILEAEEDLHRRSGELEQAAQALEDMNSCLTLASRRFEELFNGLPVACFTFDETGVIHEWNRYAEEVFGVAAFEAFQMPIASILEKQDTVIWTRQRIRDVFSGVPQDSFDWTFQPSDGGCKYLACKVICLRSMSGQAVGAICANLDITERKQAEQRIAEQAAMLTEQKAALEDMNERLNELAITDGLTGLWNHRQFQELLDSSHEDHLRSGTPYSLILLDIDFFKHFNDEFGHQVGDKVLKEFAAVLKSCARTNELPARYGGEEFAVILRGCGAEDSAKVAERFRLAIEHYPWAERPVTASLGVATVSNQLGSEKQLIAEADAALYRSKQAGRNRVTHAEHSGIQKAS